MEIKFSHVDILVKDLQEACGYYEKFLKAKISKKFTWKRDDLYVEYAVIRIGDEKIMLVQPFSGNLKNLLDTKGEGTIYRQCYSTPNILTAYKELIDCGLQPEDENGNMLSLDNLNSPSGIKIIWLPKRFGDFSIEILEEQGLSDFLNEAFAKV